MAQERDVAGEGQLLVGREAEALGLLHIANKILIAF